MIPRIGFMASAWATLAAFGTMTLISYVLGQKYYKVDYDITRIGFYITLTVVSYWLVNFMGINNTAVATATILIFIAIAFILERNELKQLISK